MRRCPIAQKSVAGRLHNGSEFSAVRAYISIDRCDFSKSVSADCQSRCQRVVGIRSQTMMSQKCIENTDFRTILLRHIRHWLLYGRLVVAKLLNFATTHLYWRLQVPILLNGFWFKSCIYQFFATCWRWLWQFATYWHRVWTLLTTTMTF